MVDNKYKYYLADLAKILKDDALEIKKITKEQKDDYTNGRLMAYYEIISLLRQQAEAFGIDLKELQLDDFNEEKELLF